MRNLWYAICDTLDDFKESRIIKRSFGWDALVVLGSDTPILELLLRLGEFALFLCERKNRR